MRLNSLLLTIGFGFSGAGVLFIPATHASEVPAQLNVPGFAGCLAEPLGHRAIESPVIRRAYSLGATDGLLLYLSVYPGVRPAGPLGWWLQDQAHQAWQTGLERAEEKLLPVLLEAAERSEREGSFEGSLTPGTLFANALESCRRFGPQAGVLEDDPLCAAVISHNALRTLGRHRRAVGVDPRLNRTVDLNPDWFKLRRGFWLERIPFIQMALLPLRPSGEGDRFGEWYHFFGILAFGLRDHAVNGNLRQTWLAVRMNQVLNPVLAGGFEEPEKARLDRDSAGVVASLLFAPRFSVRGDCEQDRDLYVAIERDGFRLSLQEPRNPR